MLQLTIYHVILVAVFVILSYSVTNVHSEVFTLPEIKLKKWISDTDRDYLDLTDVDQFAGWDENVDTPEIQISGLRSHEFTFSQHVGSVLIECRAGYPVEWVFHNAQVSTHFLSLQSIALYRLKHIC